MKLELKHIAPYLPYGVKISDGEYTRDLTIYTASYNTDLVGLSRLIRPLDHYDYSLGLPVLRPLSDYCDINSAAMSELNCDLTDQIQINELANKKISYSQLNYGVAQICFQNHIDIFGLIEKGLAINMNTL